MTSNPRKIPIDPAIDAQPRGSAVLVAKEEVDVAAAAADRLVRSLLQPTIFFASDEQSHA